MRTSLISTFRLTVCITLTLIAQVACSDKGPLNDNEGAQVAQVNTNKSNSAQIAQANNDNTERDRVAAIEPSATPGDRNANSARVPNTAARVHSPTREEVERNKEHYQRLAREQGRTIGNGPDDTWIWVRSRFLLGFSISDSRINVDVDNGAVTLSGTVINQEQVTRAESLVREIEGVRSVQNSLIVRLPE